MHKKFGPHKWDLVIKQVMDYSPNLKFYARK